MQEQESQRSSTDRSPRDRSPRDLVGIGLRGACMGAADIVPGVSGGTLAFILGISSAVVSLASVRFSGETVRPLLAECDGRGFIDRLDYSNQAETGSCRSGDGTEHLVSGE